MLWQPIVPFEPIKAQASEQGGQWTCQIKWDGVRMLVYADGGEVRLINRKGNERSMQYPELLELASYCTAESVILDGEVIAMQGGKPSFHQVMRRDSIRNAGSMPRVRKDVAITYMIFDIIGLNGRLLLEETLRQRQQMLAQLIKPGPYVQLVDNHADPEALYAVIAQHGLEGIVTKDLNSTYVINGKDKRWQKRKVYKDLHAVVGGVTHRDGIVNALLLGLYAADGQLWYIGHAGAGKLTAADWRWMTDQTKASAVSQRPFVNLPERSKQVTWLAPSLVVKVSYLEWSPHQTLRQPGLQAFVPIPPEQCTFEQ